MNYGDRLRQGEIRRRKRHAFKNNYTTPKWLEFSEDMLRRGFIVRVYAARNTFSKYVTIIMPNSHLKPFKIRFSDHKPIKRREEKGDCDFWVGINNYCVNKTENAVEAVFRHFGRRMCPIKDFNDLI